MYGNRLTADTEIATRIKIFIGASRSASAADYSGRWKGSQFEKKSPKNGIKMVRAIGTTGGAIDGTNG